MSGPVLGLGRRLQKLRAMSATEIARRVQYRWLLERERRQHGAGTLTPPDRLRRALGAAGEGADWASRLLAARRAARSRFFPSLADPAMTRALLHERYAAEVAATAHHAAAARAHRFSFFGQTFEYDAEIPWQNDPVTGAAWPSVYHADVPVHGGDVGFGDVKHVWELSRQQYLVDLAKAWFLTGGSDDLAALRRLVRSWIAGNPYATGVNWSCALEPAFRVFSWLWAYYLTVDALDEEFHTEWVEAFYDHGRFLERHLEHYSSPYNHLIAEAAALYMLGAFFPELRDAARWREAGKAVMTTRLAEQFYADGGSVEQSTFYHHATVGFYLLAGLTARATGDELPPEIWRAIERGLEYSQTLSQPDGYTPTIGGADDGKPIRMEQLPFWDFRPYLAVGSVIFGRADFRFVAGRFYEDALWLLGPDGLAAFDGLAAHPPRQTAIALPSSGYFTLRSAWAPDADYVCLDCGEQAAGMRQDAVPNSMHGHADCLSIVVWLGGKRTLVDSGLYAYNCGGEWEAHFRETAAHSTAKVDGRDQATHIRKMAWSHSYRASQEGSGSGESGSWVMGSHDGYARGPNGVRHRRTVWLRPAGYMVVLDEFEGTGSHDLEVNYQFAPGTFELVSPDRGRFDGIIETAWCGDGAWQARTACGGPTPADGWIAPSLGIRVPAPRLVLRRRMDGPGTTLLTVLAGGGPGRPHLVPLLAPRPLSTAMLAVAVNRTTEVIVARGAAPTGAASPVAPLTIGRFSDGVPGAQDVIAIAAPPAAIDWAAVESAIRASVGPREER